MRTYPMTAAAVEINPETILWGQLNTLLMPVPGDDQNPGEIEPTGPTAADEAWWSAEAPRDDDQGDDGADWDDDHVWELGPEDPEIDYAVLMSESWTLAPSAEADFEHCPGGIG